MTPEQTTVIEAVEKLQADRNELLVLLAAVAAAEASQLDGAHVIHLPGDVMARIRARLS